MMTMGAEPALAGTYGKAPTSGRLPDGAHVGRVRLQVADLERSLAYYRDLLGFREIARRDGVAILGAGDAELVELVEKRGVTPVPRRGRLGLFHFAILLPDRVSLGAQLRNLVEKGAGPGMSDHFVSEALYLYDPDGLGIEIYADRPRSLWRRTDRELAMATEPLDVDDLMRETGDARWSGMPAGTRIGHMHLHVGDLEGADTFYREALGLDLVVWSYPGAMFFSAGGYHHHLGTNTWARGASRPAPDEAQLLWWELKLPSRADVEATSTRLAGRGHTARDTGDGRLAVTDPFGTELRLAAG